MEDYDVKHHPWFVMTSSNIAMHWQSVPLQRPCTTLLVLTISAATEVLHNTACTDYQCSYRGLAQHCLYRLSVQLQRPCTTSLVLTISAATETLHNIACTDYQCSYRGLAQHCLY